MSNERYVRLKRIFKKENINGSFLIKILSKVEEQFGGISKINALFPLQTEEIVLYPSFTKDSGDIKKVIAISLEK